MGLKTKLKTYFFGENYYKSEFDSYLLYKPRKLQEFLERGKHNELINFSEIKAGSSGMRMTPLNLACYWGALESISILINHNASISIPVINTIQIDNQINTDYITSLEIALKHKKYSAAETLLKRPRSFENNAAVPIAEIEPFLEINKDANFIDYYNLTIGTTNLKNAVVITTAKQTSLSNACENGDIVAVQLLVKHHADVNIPSITKGVRTNTITNKIEFEYESEITPLQKALGRRHYHIAKHLLENGARITEDDAHTYLRYATNKDDLIFLWEVIGTKSAKSLASLIEESTQSEIHKELLTSYLIEDNTKLFYDAFISECSRGFFVKKTFEWFAANFTFNQTQLCAGFVAACQASNVDLINYFINDLDFQTKVNDEHEKNAWNYLTDKEGKFLNHHLNKLSIAGKKFTQALPQQGLFKSPQTPDTEPHTMNCRLG